MVISFQCCCILFLQNVIVILLVFYRRLVDVDHYHLVNCANVNLESMVEYVMSVENFIGTYNPQIRMVVKVYLNNFTTANTVIILFYILFQNVIVSCLVYLVASVFAIQNLVNVFVNHRLLLEDVTNVLKGFIV